MKAGGGKIINFGSGYSLRSAAGNALYSASKAGVWNLTRTMALDWAGDNIQLNLIAPGWISTEMTDPVWEDTERTAYIIDETPAGRGWASLKTWRGPVSSLPPRRRISSPATTP